MLARLKKELEIFNKVKPCDSEGGPTEDNFYIWKITIPGQEGTPFETGKFLVQLDFNNTNFPMNPPKCKFLTTVYHPNINISTGHICLDAFNSKWRKNMTICEVVTAIFLLLGKPNLNHGLNNDALETYKNRTWTYVENVKSYINKYAK